MTRQRSNYCRIVASDDDPMLLAFVVATLRDAGHCVFAAYDTDAACEKLYRDLQGKGIDVLYHDLDERPGSKFATTDLIGIPWQIIVGPKSLADGKVEVKRRSTGERHVLPVDEVAARLQTR